MNTQIQAGSPRYLELLANTALAADNITQDEDGEWLLLNDAWNQLTSGAKPAALAGLATHGMSLLCALTGIAVPRLAVDAATLHIDKNAGYAGIGNSDPWANFRLSTAFGISAFDGVLVRLSDKWIRIQNLRANPANNRVAESLNDTLSDLIAYALIALCLFEESRLDGGSV